MADLHRAAAALHRADPWRFLHDIVRVAIPERDFVKFALFMGDVEEVHALLLFDDIGALESYLEADRQTPEEDDEIDVCVSFTALELVPAPEVPAELRRRIAKHGWEVPAPHAFPMLVILDEEGLGRPPTPVDVAHVTAVASALVRLVQEPWCQVAERTFEEPFVSNYPIETTMGTLRVDVTMPILADLGDGFESHFEEDFEDEDEDDVDFDGDELEGTGTGKNKDEDEGHVADDAGAIADRFADAPEGRALGREGARWIVPLLEIAAGRYGEDARTLTPKTLEAVLFERFPTHVMAAPADARAIVDAACAFLRFATRALGSPTALRCHAVLEGDAVDRLARALGDKANFGMAKSVSVAGREAGHDMTTKAGIEAWVKELAGKPLPESIWRDPPNIAPPARHAPADAAARRNRRKAERKARKKNR
jgi:hypothetical protein